MDSELKKLKKLATFMKKEGILTYKTPEIELHLSPVAVFHKEEKAPEPSSQTVGEEFSPEFVEAAAELGMSPEDYRLIRYSVQGA